MSQRSAVRESRTIDGGLIDCLLQLYSLRTMNRRLVRISIAVHGTT